MSRRATNQDDTRAGRRAVEMKPRGGSSKTSSRGMGGAHISPSHLPPSRSSRRLNGAGIGTAGSDAEDDSEDDEAAAECRMIDSGRRAPNRIAAIPSNKKIDGVNYSMIRRRPEKRKQERKASVRKETYQIDATDSDLTDAPDLDEEDGEMDLIKGHQSESDSDGEMARKLEAAGDGESLLGSAASDGDNHDTDEEEERYIIQDVARRKARPSVKRRSKYGQDGSQGGDGEDYNELNQYIDAESGSLSPEILRRLGLDEYEDDLFAPQDPFHSSSEPSFTDFFGSDSEQDQGAIDDDTAIDLKPRLDDDELTTDDEDGSDETDISDLNEGLMSEALAAGISTQMTATTPASEIGQAEIPLLVIEDLDGRLIYARAGDGEAVFGSDGEFEFVDESDEEDTDEDMDGLGHDWNQWKAQRAIEGALGDIESDEGDTTDELPDEDMPFPRLLIGSVAPSGGRNTRRARAMAARSRRLSPNVAATSRASSVQRGQGNEVVSHSGAVALDPTLSALSSPEEQFKELDFSISTEALARDPQATLEAAARSLGLTAEEVARLVIGIQAEGSGSPTEVDGTQDDFAKIESQSTPTSKPQMGSFMPSSFKSVRRAVIDGNRQAPSPFLSRAGVQKKGLANRKRHTSNATPYSKRLRRFSSNDFASLQDITGEETSEVQTTSREASPAIDEMELDDVLDASMLIRGTHSSSPPPMGEEDQQSTPVTRSSQRLAANKNMPSPSSKQSNGAGLNLNAFARWHRIPMGAFREGQGAATSAMSQQPLGSFLLTRSNRAQQAITNRSSQQNHSPFRGRGEGDSIHFATAPAATSTDPDGRSAAFIVSPVLWPVRHSSDQRAEENKARAIQQQPAWYPTSIQSQGLGQMADDSSTVASGRKVMTKREKRLRRARKAAAAAIKVAMQEADGGGLQSTASNSPVTERDSLLNESPAMPKLSITDISSPNISPPVIGKGATMPPASAVDIPISTSSATVTSNVNSLNLLSSSASSSNGSIHQPPSSVFGVPLHSPLFGGILNPTNLGFRDDLEDRDYDNLLTL